MNLFAGLSYGSAAVGFTVLTLLLATSWRGRSVGARLILASALAAVWSVVLAVQAAGLQVPLRAVYIAEAARNAGWLLVLLGLAGSILPRPLVIGSHALWIGLLVGGLVLAALESRGGTTGGISLLLIRGGLAVAVMVLVLLEQVYRNASAQGRHGLKFLAIGLGGVYAYDLFMYSQAELLQGLPIETWAARGFVAALLVPAVAVAARRNPHWSLDVFVSRQAVMFSTMLIAAGLYLVVMALGGYYVREIGGAWGVAAQIVFLAGAGAVLAVLVFSGTIRRRLLVFLSKHFYRNKYDYRVQWLHFVETLSATEEGDPRRRSVQAVAQIFESPGGALLEFDDRGQAAMPVAAWPMPLADLRGIEPIAGHTPLVDFVRERGWVIDLAEYRRAPEVYQNLELPGWLAAGIRFRILAPVFEGERLLGLLLLFDPPPPFDLTYEDRDLLKTACRHVATLVAQHQADQRLAESRQFEAYNRLTAFMMHDLKNAIAQLQLVVSNASRHKRNPEFVDDALETVGGTVERLNSLVGQLRTAGNGRRVTEVDVAGLLRDALRGCAGRPPVPRFDGEPPDGVIVVAERDRLLAVLEHVIRNGQDATSEEGSVVVQMAADQQQVVITVSDTGSGMSPEFVRDRLFRPFDSTKGAKGMGIGAYQARELARSLGGDVEVDSRPGSGTRFRITLPRAPAAGLAEVTGERGLG